MKRVLAFALAFGLSAPVMGQTILDPAPPVTLTAFGTLPAPVTVRVQMNVTPPAGGVPAVPPVGAPTFGVFDTAVPAGRADSPTGWGATLLAAIAANPAVVAGPITFGPGNTAQMTIASAAGTRLGLRAISTTMPPLPAPLTTMPPLAAAAAAWPPTPGQLPAAAASANFASVDLAPPTPVGILGTHFIAIPPFDGGREGGKDAPKLFTSLAVPAVTEWGMIVMVLLALTAGTVVFARWRRPAAA